MKTMQLGKGGVSRVPREEARKSLHDYVCDLTLPLGQNRGVYCFEHFQWLGGGIYCLHLGVSHKTCLFDRLLSLLSGY